MGEFRHRLTPKQLEIAPNIVRDNLPTSDRFALARLRKQNC